jgi:hypothetical protein
MFAKIFAQQSRNPASYSAKYAFVADSELGGIMDNYVDIGIVL